MDPWIPLRLYTVIALLEGGVGVGWGFLFSQQLLLHHQSRAAIFSRSRCMAAVLAQDDDRNVGWGGLGWGVAFLYVFGGSRMSIS